NGTISISSTFNWSGGSLGWTARVTIADVGVLNLSGIADKTIYGLLMNSGTVQWTGADDLILDGGAVYNLPGGTFDLQNDEFIGCGFTTCGTFDNAGLFRKSGGGGFSDINVPISNTGTVEVESGWLRFNGASVFNTG